MGTAGGPANPDHQARRDGLRGPPQSPGPGATDWRSPRPDGRAFIGAERSAEGAGSSMAALDVLIARTFANTDPRTVDQQRADLFSQLPHFALGQLPGGDQRSLPDLTCPACAQTRPAQPGCSYPQRGATQRDPAGKSRPARHHRARRSAPGRMRPPASSGSSSSLTPAASARAAPLPPGNASSTSSSRSQPDRPPPAADDDDDPAPS